MRCSKMRCSNYLIAFIFVVMFSAWPQHGGRGKPESIKKRGAESMKNKSGPTAGLQHDTGPINSKPSASHGQGFSG